MRVVGVELSFSATDLSNFLNCHHLTALGMAEALGTRKRPVWNDPLLDILAERGLAHERAHIEKLRQSGSQVTDLTYVEGRENRVAQTIEAMRAGAEVIVQGALLEGKWFGRPDIIQRVERPSTLGSWSYEIWDTKLARETRAGTILQLCLYSELLATAQGVKPENFYVVTPHPESPINSYRFDDYAAYFRLIRKQMEAAISLGEESLGNTYYPEPVDHCDVCDWSSECKHKRRADDHLSLVAGITRLQRREFESQRVKTLADLAKLAVPLPFKPSRGESDTYVRVREQARLQFESRGKNPPLREFRQFDSGAGFCRLPEPSPGDVFLDLEGDPYAVEGGREYLFGVVTIGDGGNPVYRAFWGFTDQEEKAAFEAVIDLIEAATKKHEGMHVYHYAPYEPSAFKRLMGRYVTRETELDRMLRARRFVDLYAVVRQGVMAGIERYSIKNLEAFYSFDRTVSLDDANRALRLMEHGLEMGCPGEVPQAARDIVEGYNKDDCVSTLHLRNWLETLRTELESTGVSVLRPVAEDGSAPEKVDDRAMKVNALRARLLDGIPEARAERNEHQHAQWILAYLLDWHRREDKAEWWEYFRLRELPEEDLLDEPQALAGLTNARTVSTVSNKKTGKPTGSVIDRYEYPVQEMEIARNAELKLQDGAKFGDVVDLNRIARTIDIKKGPKQAKNHPTAVFAHTHISSAVQEEALFQLGESVARSGLDCPEANAADGMSRRFLLGMPPKLRVGSFAPEEQESAGDFAVRMGNELGQSVLAIQGPPGSGKTFTGARMICALVAQGKKVGITATSHSVIRHLLHGVSKEGRKSGVSVKLGHRCEELDQNADGISIFGANEQALQSLQNGEANVVGGTSWLWARPEFAKSVDVLFIDEAGQLSLANALAVARAADNLVLLGDPQQLDQPKKGSHPEGVNVSALGHILGRHKTIPPERGIFLPLTWRLAPSICAFTSEVFYEGRLASRDGLNSQKLGGPPDFEGNGLWVVEVEHVGNCNASPEEVEAVIELVTRLSSPGKYWVDQDGERRQLNPQDILVVSPYNAQVARLTERLQTLGVSVGTVDKFQGQEAPVVIYSTATSTPEDAPRGMEFLYNPNRLNVATSRARCAAIIVASSKLFEPDCRTPRQMNLANALCRYREQATVIVNAN
jgi:predicted RecB family nuclease